MKIAGADNGTICVDVGKMEAEIQAVRSSKNGLYTASSVFQTGSADCALVGFAEIASRFLQNLQTYRSLLDRDMLRFGYSVKEFEEEDYRIQKGLLEGKNGRK